MSLPANTDQFGTVQQYTVHYVTLFFAESFSWRKTKEDVASPKRMGRGEREYKPSTCAEAATKQTGCQPIGPGKQ